MITGADRGVLIKYNTGVLSTGMSSANIVDFVIQYKKGTLSAGVISDDDRSVCSIIFPLGHNQQESLQAMIWVFVVQ